MSSGRMRVSHHTNRRPTQQTPSRGSCGVFFFFGDFVQSILTPVRELNDSRQRSHFSVGQVDRRLVGLPGIGDQTSQKIDQEVGQTAMASMGNLGDIFQLVVDGFNQGSFASQQLVSQGHQTIFHVFADGSDQLQLLFK